MSGSDVRRAFDSRVASEDDDGVIDVGSERWRLYVLASWHLGRDWFVHVAALGPRTCTVLVRAAAPREPSAAARAVLHTIIDWLASGDAREQVYLELKESSPCQ